MVNAIRIGDRGEEGKQISTVRRLVLALSEGESMPDLDCLRENQYTSLVVLVFKSKLYSSMELVKGDYKGEELCTHCYCRYVNVIIY